MPVTQAITVLRQERILVERREHLLLIGINRPEKRNACDFQLLQELSQAYQVLEAHADLRVGVVYAVGEHFTAGLDLTDLMPRIDANGLKIFPEDGIDPWRVSARGTTKPVVVAVQGFCFTLGIELILASDIAIAAEDTNFAQLEVARAILPFGGATLRFANRCGWGNAMRYMLTADNFDAAEAYRIGLVQQVVSVGEQLDTAIAIAERIAAQAPLAVQATLANARKAADGHVEQAKNELQPELVRLISSADASIGMQAFINRVPAKYLGK